MTQKQTKKFLAAFAVIMGVGVMGAGLTACSKATTGVTKGQSQYEIESDLPIGSKDAKVVVVEYASVMCPHCANFQNKVVPQIMKNLVETGKVRYVFREFPTAPVDLASAGHLIGRCVDPSKREAVINALMNQQQDIYVAAQSGGAKQALLTVAQSAGMNESQFDACMKDEKKLSLLADVMKYGEEHDKVTATPTVFVNGKAVTSPVGREYEYADVEKAVNAALGTAK